MERRLAAILAFDVVGYSRLIANDLLDENAASRFPGGVASPAMAARGNGAALLDALAEATARYVALPEHGATMLALWVIHSHCIDGSSITPRVAITSPTNRCGKSTLLRLLAKLVAGPLPPRERHRPALEPRTARA
jgi:hypothetical protein